MNVEKLTFQNLFFVSKKYSFKFGIKKATEI